MRATICDGCRKPIEERSMRLALYDGFDFMPMFRAEVHDTGCAMDAIASRRWDCRDGHPAINKHGRCERCGARPEPKEGT